jgi:hypothetical protein
MINYYWKQTMHLESEIILKLTKKTFEIVSIKSTWFFHFLQAKHFQEWLCFSTLRDNVRVFISCVNIQFHNSHFSAVIEVQHPPGLIFTN